LARALVAVFDGRATGVLHGVYTGECSRFEFARAIFAEAGLDPERVVPVPTSDMPRPAARPAYAPLAGEAWRAAGLPPLRPWRDALREVVPGVLEALDADARAAR
ncbi:MAG: NAD(P)-dependent oxidoreductase, partial [Actinobacteria bacterium]|nr:NAD(P)-dependent oxidoreductase [Actinomycetota bacterium]